MICTRCKQPISRSGIYHRTKKGPHHAQCPASVAERSAEEWWRADGVYIDPDTEEVDWFDKRRELAQLAFIAGFNKATEVKRK